MDIGFSGRESHPRSRELLSSLPLSIDYEVLFSDLPCVWLRKDHPVLNEAWNLDSFLRYPHISICWEQSDTWALDNVLQESGRERTIAMSLPEFEQALFMAAQPDNLLLATAPRYCQYYNQLHQLPLVALPLPFDEIQQKSWKYRLLCCGTNGIAITRRLSGYEKPLKIFTPRWHNQVV